MGAIRLNSAAFVTGLVVTGAPVIAGVAVRRIGWLMLLGNVVAAVMAAGFELERLDSNFVESFVLGAAYGQIVVLGLVTSWWQIEGLDELSDREDQPRVFGHSHRYWRWRLWWSAYHVVKFHRLVQRERAEQRSDEVPL